MGQSSQFICQKQQPKSDPASSQASSVRSPQSNEASSSDEEDEEEVDIPPMPQSMATTAEGSKAAGSSQPESM